MSFIDDILNSLAGPLRQYSHPPSATLLVLGAAIVLSLITMSANRFLVNYKMIANTRREYATWTMAVRKAKKEGDDKQLEKLMRRQSAPDYDNTFSLDLLHRRHGDWLDSRGVRAACSTIHNDNKQQYVLSTVPLLLVSNMLIHSEHSTVEIVWSPVLVLDDSNNRRI